MIVLNLKTYQESIDKCLLFCDIANEVVAESGLRIIVCPPTPFLKDAAEKSVVFAQHVDFEEPGAFTGTVNSEMLKAICVKGSIINHSESKLAEANIKKTIDALHRNSLESLVCAATTNEAVKIAGDSPTFIAVEPPELIGSGVSVSKAKPEIVINSVRAIKDVNHKVTVLCGAGVSNKSDVKKAIELGSEGVLLASAFVKSKDPKEFLRDLSTAFE